MLVYKKGGVCVLCVRRKKGGVCDLCRPVEKGRTAPRRNLPREAPIPATLTWAGEGRKLEKAYRGACDSPMGAKRGGCSSTVRRANETPLRYPLRVLLCIP